ncbi:hypothetical protein IKX73_02180, partial [Candidatus Saccharibacteria bacterium]|nr:hypothetical protein [Candidatus Saccharibacteria bacterium]
MAIMLLSAILVFVGVLLIAATLEHALNHGFETDKDGGEMPSYLSRTGESGWIMAVSLALVAGLARYAAVAAGWSAVAAIILMTAAMIYLAIWWWRDGDRFGEFLLFLLLSIIFGFILRAACAKIVEEGFVKTPFWASVWTVAYPRILALCVTGFMLVSLLQRSYGRTGKRWQYLLAWVFLVLYILSILACLIFGVNWKSLRKQEQRVIPTATATPAVTATAVPTTTPTTTPTATPDATPRWYFYNTNLLGDNEPSNDFNFGTHPIEKLLKKKLESGELKLESGDWLYELMVDYDEATPFEVRFYQIVSSHAGKNPSKKQIEQLAEQYELRFFEIISAKELDQELRERLDNDPALGAAVMAWCDAKLGTRYLGVFYDEVEGKWDAAMNAAKVRWMEYPADYNRTLAAFFTFLDQAKVEVVAVSGGLNDQMYMNPYTTDHVPDVIVRETTDTKGLFLRYTFNIKGQETEVAYRIDCGFQPTNVATLMKITPQKPTPTPPPAPPP